MVSLLELAIIVIENKVILYNRRGEKANVIF